MPLLASEKKRIVVKVGGSILTTASGHFSKASSQRICKGLLLLLQEGHEVILTSSGAIACGMAVLGLKQKPSELRMLQACAAIGQGKLMKLYEDFFSKNGFHTAQILLTRQGMGDRQRYLNTRNTMLTLIEMKVLPVVNENDTVATEEIRFGDNDTLSAMVGALVGADILIILSDVDGIYREDKSCVHIVETASDFQKVRQHLKPHGGGRTSGGMETKLSAARFAVQSGISVVIANGRDPDVLSKIISGQEVGTFFKSSSKRRKQKKNWIASGYPKGQVKIDAGAKLALVSKGKSLLASGITRVEGKFELGDLVSIQSERGEEIARGLINYTHEEVDEIKGLQSAKIKKMGYVEFEEVIHRNNLVLSEGTISDEDSTERV